MPYDSNGNASLVPGYFVQNGDDVLPSQHNPPLEDIASMLSQALLRDGRAPLTGNLNGNGNKITNLAAPTNSNDAARLADLTSGLPKITVYDTAGTFTHNFETTTKKFQVEGCGGGAPGGPSNSGTFSTTNFGSGGPSGWFYPTDVLDKGSVATASLTIGAGGTGTPSAQTDGGSTTYTDGVNSFTWPGGKAPPSLTGFNAASRIFRYAQTAAPVGIPTARFGLAGFGCQNIDGAGSGEGGSTPYGQGGLMRETQGNGNDGTGNGSGGGGSLKSSGTPGFNGGAGRPGIIIIREWS